VPIHRIVTAGLVLGLGIALGGCSPDETTERPPKHAVAQPTPTPTATPEKTVTKDASRKPRGNDSASATAFVKRFLAAHNDALATGDFSEVTAMSSDGCQGCQMAASYYSKLYDDGGRVEGGAFTKPTFEVEPQSDGTTIVKVTSTVSAYTIVTADGTEQKFPSKRDVSTFTLTKGSDGEWQVASWEYGS
jgi:hypothetical protein